MIRAGEDGSEGRGVVVVGGGAVRASRKKKSRTMNVITKAF